MHAKFTKLIAAVGKRIGTQSIKQRIWDSEHANGHWDWTKDPTRPTRRRDIAYEVLDRHSAGIAILDLGCGDGFTCGSIASHFSEYLGVDISKVATENARQRIAEEPEKAPKCRFEASDILTFVPPKPYGLILFSDCLQYFAAFQIKSILQRYSQSLSSEGLLVARLCDRDKYKDIVTQIQSNYRVLEMVTREDSAGVVLTFAPRQ